MRNGGSRSCDFAVVGSGFGGSLFALIAARYGLRVQLFDRGRHPRFAIGESMTPLASQLLRNIADEHDLPQLRPLCEYGLCKASYPQLTVGLKRGFTYVHHSPGHKPLLGPGSDALLMFAASSRDEIADMHFVRSELDAFLFNEARAAGVRVAQETEVSASQDGESWRLRWPGGEVHAAVVVDATGSPEFTTRSLSPEQIDPTSFATQSSCIYTHVRGLRTVSQCVAEVPDDWTGGMPTYGEDELPFPMDAAAVHHLLEEGWMWQLPFDDGRVSIGLCFEGHGDRTETDFRETVARYPMLAHQFKDAVLADSPGRWLSVPVLQRAFLWPNVGPGWLLLPGTYGFVDPMHSTGLATTLGEVARWGMSIKKDIASGVRTSDLPVGQIHRELDFIDDLVALAYRTRRLGACEFEAAVSLYEAAAISTEADANVDSGLYGVNIGDRHSSVRTLREFVDTVDPKDKKGHEMAMRVFRMACRDVAHQQGVDCLFDPAADRRYAATAAR